MKSAKIKHTDDKGEMNGELVRIKDFLPLPGEPVESITVTLSGDVPAFFQREAGRRNASYQQITRNLVRRYPCSRPRAKT